MSLSHLKFRHLMLVEFLVRHGTLHKAARLLNISQPAATGMLNDLEQLLGISLFTRSRLGVAPTPSAQALLAKEHKIAVRVVSMPSTTTFDRQDTAYKADVLPKGLPRIAVEMGSTDGWWKYGVAAVVGLDTYGESAPAPVLFQHFGFTPENVADTVRTVLAK